MKLWRPGRTVALAWLVATALGVGVAWFGLRPVLDVAVPDRSDPLSAAEVRKLAEPSAIPIPPGYGSWPAGSPSWSGSVSPSQSASPKSSGSPKRSPSGKSPSPASTIVDGWTVTTQPDGTLSYVRSFRVRGGSTVIRMTPGRVYLVSATPNPDFSVQPTQNDATRLVVQFVAAGKYDIVDAMWWNDHPYAQVSEVG